MGNDLAAERIGTLAMCFVSNETRGGKLLAWHLREFYLAQYDSRTVFVISVVVSFGVVDLIDSLWDEELFCACLFGYAGVRSEFQQLVIMAMRWFSAQ